MATGIKTPWKTLLAGAVFLLGCADLALESDRIPTEMVVGPPKDRILEGESFQLEVVIRDQDEKVIRIPSWAPPTWTVSDPAVAEVRPDGMLDVMKTGRVNLTASAAGLSASASYCISGDKGRLGLPMYYVTQAAQNEAHNAPVIAGRPALLRLFLSAPQPLDFAPEIRISTVRDDEVVWEHTFVPDRPIPNSITEEVLEGSFNVEIPGSALEPGVGLVVEFDPDCKAPITPGSRTRYPQTGSKDLRVEEVQLFRQIFVPTVWRTQPDPALGRWLDGINPNSDQMHLSRNLLPVAEVEVEVRDTLRTNNNLATFNGWGQWINEISVIAIQDGRRGYYYGVIGTSPTGLLGLANFAVPWSVGVAEASTYTHEIGHNMNLRHAPCGGAGGPDPDYPYGNASIGIWGYDFDNKVLYNPDTYVDVMSYCNPVWISDFYFDKATTHRITGDGGVDTSDGAISPDRGEMLVVWGTVIDGELKLDPAFVLKGPAELPGADGPYRVEGLGADGERRFSLSFTPTPLEHGGGSFVFFVPYEPEWATTLDRMVLTGPEGEDTVIRGGEPAMAVLTDPSTGSIQAFYRNWDGERIPGEETANVTVTRGIPEGGLPR